jgi:hypothetical protein
MEEYQVNYAKIFSATGVLYVWQHPWSDELFFSKIYDTLNGEVERTACLILEALAEATRRANQPQSLAKTVINWLPRRVLSWMIDLVQLCSNCIYPTNCWFLETASLIALEILLGF